MSAGDEYVAGAGGRAYIARTSGREAYKRAMETCHFTRAWAAKAKALGQ